MEEKTYVLLMRVLKIHYKDRLQILDEALKVIKEYSNKPMSSQNEYDVTSLTLQSMLNDLPSEILKYFLTMLPLPKNKEILAKNNDEKTNNSVRAIQSVPLKRGVRSEKVSVIRGFTVHYIIIFPANNDASADLRLSVDASLNLKSADGSLFAGIRAILLKYLNEEIPPLVPISKQESKAKPTINGNSKEATEVKTPVTKSIITLIKKPIARAKRKCTVRATTDCKKLLDLCAEYVIQNRASLSQNYMHRKEKVWKMVNSNKYVGDVLEKLYVVIRDLNKKIKWMRQMDSDDIPVELIKEEYGCSDIFIKERNLEELLKEDPFQAKAALRNAVSKFVYN